MYLWQTHILESFLWAIVVGIVELVDMNEYDEGGEGEDDKDGIILIKIINYILLLYNILNPHIYI